MSRDSRGGRGAGGRRALGRTALLVSAALALASADTSTASAEWRPSGAVTGNLLLRSPDVGGGGLVDLYAEPTGTLRLGGAMGLGALSSSNGNRSRVFMPIGLSAALELRGPRVGLDLRLRAGLWGGATNQGLAAGPWLSGGAYLELPLDRRIAVAAGVDVWLLFGHGDAGVIAPGLGLVWTPGNG